MDITKIDYLQYATNAENVYKNKLKWKPQLPDYFLDHTLPILSSVPLEYENGLINTNKTIKSLEKIDVINTPNGKMTGKNIMYLIKFLYYQSRSELLPVPQNKAPRLAALTPLMLYAHKLYNEIPYSKWSKSPGHGVTSVLGVRLMPILEIKELPTDYNVNELRELALTYKSGKRAGQLAPITAYKCNLRRIGNMDLPNIAMIMILQLWIANASLRNTESMILDPVNWDNIPEPIDVTIPKEKVIEKPNEEIKEDLPWI